MKPMPTSGPTSSPMYANRERDGMGRIGAEKPEACFNAPKDAGLQGKKGEATIAWRRLDNGMIEVTAVNGVSLGEEKPGSKGEPDMDDGEDQMEMDQAGTGPGYPES